MRGQLRRLHSPDVFNLSAYAPESPRCFSFLLQVMAGPENGDGEESFDVLVCTPEWLSRTHDQSSMVIGRHHLVVFEYNHERLHEFLDEYCRECSGAEWREVAEKIGRLGKWEFEDYIPPSP